MNRIDQIPADAPELAQPGPYPVGVETLHFTNPDQVDVLRSQPGLQRADRPLTVELWYPAQAGTPSGTVYTTLLRDGHGLGRLHGAACREAVQAVGSFPLVIISHGYVVASLDHTDSTYADKGALASTLVNRPADTAYARRVLHDRADCSRTAIIGYSMGGYGALVSGGAGDGRGPPAWPVGFCTDAKG